jgi:hypothetical protein
MSAPVDGAAGLRSALGHSVGGPGVVAVAATASDRRERDRKTENEQSQQFFEPSIHFV